MNIGTIAVIGSILAGLISIPAAGVSITGDVAAAGAELTGMSNDSFQETPKTVSSEISSDSMSKTVETAFGTVTFNSEQDLFSAELESPRSLLEINREPGSEVRNFTGESVSLTVENTPSTVTETCETPEGTLETVKTGGEKTAEFSGLNRKKVEDSCTGARERMKEKITRIQNIAADLGMIPDLEIIRVNESKEEVVIRNSGESTVNLAGWEISDESDNSFSFGPIPLQPDETMTVYSPEEMEFDECEESEEPDYERCWDSSYVWNNDGETATLVNPRGEAAATFTYE
ncbi:MAG: lamin tail domain-containing protein [Candidatus Nanohaloarchaeota archaeon QJJ-7]|nr:lamin tail domain-containing protein [Candidatus Nanohaloarchaeota archaeon QJJ-7]